MYRNDGTGVHLARMSRQSRSQRGAAVRRDRPVTDRDAPYGSPARPGRLIASPAPVASARAVRRQTRVLALPPRHCSTSPSRNLLPLSVLSPERGHFGTLLTCACAARAGTPQSEPQPPGAEVTEGCSEEARAGRACVRGYPPSLHPGRRRLQASEAPVTTCVGAGGRPTLLLRALRLSRIFGQGLITRPLP